MNKKKALYTSLTAIALASFSVTSLAEEIGVTSVVDNTVTTTSATTVSETILYGESGEVLFAGSLENSGYSSVSDLLVGLGYPADATLINEERGAVASAESGTIWVYRATVVAPKTEVKDSSSATDTVTRSVTYLYNEAGQLLFEGNLAERGFTDIAELLVNLGYPADATLINEERGAAGSVGEDGKLETIWVHSATVVAPKAESNQTPMSIANGIDTSSVFSLLDESGKVLFSGTLADYGFASMSELLVSLGYPADSEFTNPNGGAVSSADGGAQWVWSWTVVAPKTENIQTPTSIANSLDTSSLFSLLDESGKVLFSGTLAEYGFANMTELLVSLGYPADSEFTNPNGGAVSSADGGTQWVWSWTVVAPKTESIQTPTSIANNLDTSSLFSLLDESGKVLFSGTLAEYGFSTMSELLVSLGYPADSEFTNPNGGAVSSADGGTQWVWSWTVVAPKPEDSSSKSETGSKDSSESTQPTQASGGAGGAAGASQGSEDKTTAQTSSELAGTSATASQPSSKTSGESGRTTSKSSKSLPNTGDTTSIIGMIGLGISVLGLTTHKRRKA